MINIKNAKLLCREDISKIKNYDLAIADTEHTWHCHHRNGLTFTMKELMKMNMYYHRPADELIFLFNSEHRSLHNKFMSEERKQKISKANSIPRSVFGEKFKEHFGITRKSNPKIYEYERRYFKKYGKCSWEVSC